MMAALLVALRKRNFLSFSFRSPSMLHILTFSACSHTAAAIYNQSIN